MPNLGSVLGQINPNDLDPILRNKLLCHQATLTWLVRASLGRYPTLVEYGLASIILRKLSRLGSPLTRPGDGKLRVQPGTILFFDGPNDHSCIATNWDQIVGYNQTDWFPGGRNNQYTLHNLADIKWLGKTEVQGNGVGKKCTLFAVNERTALGNIEKIMEAVEKADAEHRAAHKAVPSDNI